MDTGFTVNLISMKLRQKADTDSEIVLYSKLNKRRQSKVKLKSLEGLNCHWYKNWLMKLSVTKEPFCVINASLCGIDAKLECLILRLLFIKRKLQNYVYQILLVYVKLIQMKFHV